MKALSIVGAVALAALGVGRTASAADAYIEVDGTFGIDTRYNVKNSTRCEIDYALTEARRVRRDGDAERTEDFVHADGDAHGVRDWRDVLPLAEERRTD